MMRLPFTKIPNLFLIPFVFFILFSDLKSNSVGSTTAVSIQSFQTFPTSENTTVLNLNNNQIIGFALMAGGIGFGDSGTICTFDGVFAIEAAMYFNGGTMILERDMKVDMLPTFTSLGSIVGNGNSCYFSRTLEQIGQTGTSYGYFGNLAVSFESDVILDTTLTFSGACEIDGHGTSLIFTDYGNIIVAPNSNLTIKNITLQNVSGTCLACADNTGSINLENVDMMLDGLYTFSFGGIIYTNEVTLLGTGTFVYDSQQTSTLETASKLHVTTYVCLNIGNSSINGATPLYFADSTSMLYLDNCNMFIRYPGFNLLTGTVFVDRDVVIDMSSTSTSTGFVLGDGVNPNNDATVYYSPAAIITFNTGYLVYNNVGQGGFVSSTTDSKLVRNVGAYSYIAKTWNLSNITSKETSWLVPPLELDPSAQLIMNNVNIEFPDSVFNLTGALTNASAFNLNGNDTLFLSQGTFLAAMVVSGSGNGIYGAGKLANPIIFTGPTAQLTWDALGLIQSTIELNYGTLTLNQGLTLDYGVGIYGPGTINTGSNFITIDSDGSVLWNTPLLFNGTMGGVELNSNMTLSAQWTCTGAVTIDGHGYTLDLDTNGAIMVESGSSLTLQNITLKDATQAKIQCIDNTGSITLQNVNWVLDDIYTFSYGAMQFLDQVTYSGTGTFVYDCANTSTVMPDTQLTLSNGITFNVGRNIISGNQPFYYSDGSSKIVLDDCFFFIRYPGMSFTRGTFFLNRNIIIDGNSTSTQTGLILGDGMDPANDMTVYYSPGAVTVYNTGYVTYNNVNSNEFNSASISSQIVRNIGASMYIAQTWNLSNITSKITSDSASPLQFAPAAQLNYNNVVIDLPEVVFTANGAMSNPYVLNLNGNDSLSLSTGAYDLGLEVYGTGNTLVGNGNMFGPIIFLSPSATLSWGGNGMIFVSPELNGGTLILAKNLDCGPGVSLTGPGSINLSYYTMSLNMQNSPWTTPLAISGEGGSVVLRSNMVLSNAWTCTGDVAINGANHTLSFDSSGSITVESGSTLTFQNVILENVAGANISCVDNTGHIVFQNAQIECTADITFPYGSLEFYKNNRFKGGYVFAYESTQTSTIDAQSTLLLDTNFTFSYYPANYVTNLLQCVDYTSEFILHNASLISTPSGMDLTTGTVIIEGISTYAVDSNASFGVGLTVGDGTVVDDCTCFITNGSQLQVLSGALNYNNADPASLIMQNNLSTFYFAPGTMLNLLTSMNLGAGEAIFGNGCQLNQAPGVQLLGAVIPQGTLYRVGG